jgi:hypothetical protein
MPLVPSLAAVLCALAVFLAPCPAAAGQQPTLVGGPCRYDTFAGKATIVSIEPGQTPKTGAEAAPPYTPLTVTYTFTPSAPITGEPLYKPDVAHTLTLVNGMQPGSRFVAKYGLSPGKIVPCELRIIRQGTCTPVLYVFPGIDLTDYFELTRP